MFDPTCTNYNTKWITKYLICRITVMSTLNTLCSWPTLSLPLCTASHENETVTHGHILEGFLRGGGVLG